MLSATDLENGHKIREGKDRGTWSSLEASADLSIFSVRAPAGQISPTPRWGTSSSSTERRGWRPAHALILSAIRTVPLLLAITSSYETVVEQTYFLLL